MVNISHNIKPKVIIPTGLGINSHEELGQAFKNAGAEPYFILVNDLIANPNVMDNYQMAGLPGGFMMGDHLGAGQSTRNRIDGTNLMDKLYEKLADKEFPIYAVCNSLQLLAKLDLFPVYVGTVKNASGKHETGSWDMKVNQNNDTVWIKDLKNYSLPIMAPSSHGEGRIRMTPEDLKKAEEMNLIALTYADGHMTEYFKSSRYGKYNPNGSISDIAGFGWNNNLVLFPHFERLLRNVQREDRALLLTGKLQSKFYEDTPDGLFEPTYRIFKPAVDYVK